MSPVRLRWRRKRVAVAFTVSIIVLSLVGGFLKFIGYGLVQIWLCQFLVGCCMGTVLARRWPVHYYEFTRRQRRDHK